LARRPPPLGMTDPWRSLAIFSHLFFFFFPPLPPPPPGFPGLSVVVVAEAVVAVAMLTQTGLMPAHLPSFRHRSLPSFEMLLGVEEMPGGAVVRNPSSQTICTIAGYSKLSPIILALATRPGWPQY